MGPAEWGLLLLLAVPWGGSFFFSRIAVGGLPPLTVVLARVTLATLALHVFVLLSERRMLADPRQWGTLCVMGLVINVLFGNHRAAAVSAPSPPSQHRGQAKLTDLKFTR